MVINTQILSEGYQSLSIKLLTNIRNLLQFRNAETILRSLKLGHSLKIWYFRYLGSLLYSFFTFATAALHMSIHKTTSNKFLYFVL